MLKNICRAISNTVKECSTIAKEEFNKEWNDYTNSESYKNNKAQIINNLGKAKANIEGFKGAWGEFKDEVNKSAEEYGRKQAIIKKEQEEIEATRRRNKNNMLITNKGIQTINTKDKVEPSESKSWEI